MPAKKIFPFLFYLLILLPKFVIGQQEVTIELGKKVLTLNENFSIKVIIKNADKWEAKGFPEIQGFSKNGTSVAHALNKQTIATHTVTQNYIATKEGKYKLPSFSININGQEFTADGTTITIDDSPSTDNADDAAANNIKNINPKEEAFLALNVDKKRVYVGEGFRVTIGFYVAETNTAAMKFPDDLEAQLSMISKKFQSSDCMEERLPISEVSDVPSLINGKKYSFYKVFESIYYPLNNKPIHFQPVALRMTKIKNNKQKESIQFTSNSLIINPLSLPEHPLKNKVVVGNYSLFEKIESKKIETGKSFTYLFRIVGQGNLSTINMPTIANDSYFDFYPPQVQTIKSSGETSAGKEFRYQIVPKSAGKKSLNNYFYWVFFNTEKEKYDTLKSHLTIQISGQTVQDKSIRSSGDIYENIDKLGTANIETDYREVMTNIVNFLVILMLIGVFFLFEYRRRKKKNSF